MKLKRGFYWTLFKTSFKKIARLSHRMFNEI